MKKQKGAINAQALSTPSTLESFQFRPYIKTVNILLPNYRFRHTTEIKGKNQFVGRELARKRLFNYLKDGGQKGAYLVTGYRGMGKTSLVNAVIEDLTEYETDGFSFSDCTTKKVSISFGQKNITELDILRQIVFEVKSHFENDFRYRLTKGLNNPIWGIGTSIVTFLIFFGPIFSNAIKSNVEIKVTENVFSALILSAIFGAFIAFFLKAVSFTFWKFNKVYLKTIYLYDRCSSQFTSEENAGTGADQFPIILSRKKSKAYPIAGSKEISNEIIHILREAEKAIQYRFIFIFDELDKIDSTQHQIPIYEDTEMLELKGETVSFNEHRKRKKLILDILSSMKYLVTEANAKFIFVAGSEMFDAALADVSDRYSAISSIFGHIINVDSLYKDYSRENITGVGITHLVEEFMIQITDPDSYCKEGRPIRKRRVGLQSLLKLDWVDINGHALSLEDKLKVIYTLQHFITYLAYRSTGSPKKMIRLIEEHVFDQTKIERKDRALNTNTEIFTKSSTKYERTENYYVLRIGYKDQYKSGLLNYFYRPVILSRSRTLKHYSNSLLVAVPYLMDHIIKFHGSAFSMENLELLPEVLSANRNPELRLFLEELIETFKLNLIRNTDTKFFDYKFNYKVFNEIVNVSILFAEESAAFNFTLDENYNIKVYLRLKIKELRSIYKDFGGEQSSMTLESIALYNGLLGDVSYFDREFSDAVGAYYDALAAIRGEFKTDGTTLDLAYSNFVTYIKYLLKLGLCFEKMKSYDKAMGCYLDAMQLIDSYKPTKEKHTLAGELNRHYINAFFGSQFLIEKHPTLAISQQNPNFDHIMDTYDDSNRLSVDLLVHRSILKFYRNERMQDLKSKARVDLEQALSICLDFEHIASDNINHLLNYLWVNFNEKTLARNKAQTAARILARYGNLLYSDYMHVKGNKYQMQEQIKLNNEEMQKHISDFVQRVSKLQQSNEYTDDSKNSSARLKCFIQTYMHKTDSGSSEVQNVKPNSLCFIFLIYAISAKLYLYVDGYIMGSHQYRKILSILRSHAPVLNQVLQANEQHKEFFLIFLQNTFVQRSIQISSWMSSSTDRNQFYKYKHVFDEDQMIHPKGLSKYNYHATSNAADTKEALWHYIVIEQICNRKSCIPSTVVTENPNQSFVHQAVVVHTMFARMNELQVQCVINRSLFEECLNKSGISLETIKATYLKLQEANPNLHLEFTKKQIQTLSELPYLIANWIYCLHNIILIMQTKGLSYMITYSSMGDFHRRLGEVFKYYEYLKVVHKYYEDQIPDVFRLTRQLVGEDFLRGTDTISLFQQATRYYRLSYSVHNCGGAYRNLISNMYYLEDDFHDNVFHFSIAFERQQINSGEIMQHIRKLSDELGASQYFEYESHVNTELYHEAQNNKV